MNKVSKLSCAAVLGVAGMFSAESAQAADWGFSISLGGRRPAVHVDHRPEVRYERRWVPERYETRCDEVLVAPARCDKIWVEPVYQTSYDRYGRRRTLMVTPGHYKEVHIPARYETRHTRVLIPGYWETVPVTVDRRHDHDDHRRPSYAFYRR